MLSKNDRGRHIDLFGIFFREINQDQRQQFSEKIFDLLTKALYFVYISVSRYIRDSFKRC